MGYFDDIVEEAENKNSFDNSDYKTKKKIETNGSERSEEIKQYDEEENNEVEEKEQEENNEVEEKPGLFNKLKNAFWTSPEDKQQKKMVKMKAEEERLNSKLLFQKKKNELSNKRAEIAKLAQERRKNSPIGKTFTKIGNFVKTNAQQGGKVRDPLREIGESGIGMPNRQPDIFGQTSGVNFGLIGRPAPAPQQKIKVKKNTIRKPAYQTQQPYRSGIMNTNLLNEFGSQMKKKSNKKQPGLGLYSGKW